MSLSWEQPWPEALYSWVCPSVRDLSCNLNISLKGISANLGPTFTRTQRWTDQSLWLQTKILVFLKTKHFWLLFSSVTREQRGRLWPSCTFCQTLNGWNESLALTYERRETQMFNSFEFFSPHGCKLQLGRDFLAFVHGIYFYFFVFSSCSSWKLSSLLF